MAVDPQRLQAHLDEIAGLSTDPEGLQRATLQLLEHYQVRRRRAGRTQASVPQPVLRSLARTLRSRLKDDEGAVGAAATALWSAGRGEARSLAARLLADQRGELAPDLAERWTRSSVPVELVRELAEVSLAGWRRASPERFSERCGEWLDGKHRLLGLYALRAAVRDPQFENLPRVYKQISGLGGSLRGRPRRAMLELVRALAWRAPSETVRFLRDELQESGAPAKRLIRDALPSLPAEQREALRGANGIIRPQTGRRAGGE